MVYYTARAQGVKGLGEMGEAMETESDFLAVIRADRANDTPRLIFADWLEEQGQTKRAEFIRVQLRLYQLENGPGEEAFLRAKIDSFRARQKELLELPEVIDNYKSTPVFGKGAHWQRGFVAKVTTNWTEWLKYAKTILAVHPVEAVEFLSLPETVHFNEATCSITSFSETDGAVSYLLKRKVASEELHFGAILDQEWPDILFGVELRMGHTQRLRYPWEPENPNLSTTRRAVHGILRDYIIPRG